MMMPSMMMDEVESELVVGVVGVEVYGMEVGGLVGVEVCGMEVGCCVGGHD